MPSLQNPVAKRRRQDILFFLLLSVAAVFLFQKCRFGFGNIDESFYLTVPRRLLQGDALFQHEWHLSQMASLLTMPLMALLMKIGGTEGLILSMRCATVIIQCAIALTAYLRLRKISWIGAVCASLSFVIYIPFGIMALSYNSMGIMALIMSGLAILPAQQDGSVRFVFSGLCFAAAVLCCPYLLIAYVIYTMIAGISALMKRGSAFRSWIWFTAGAIALAAVFAVFVLSRASIQGMIQSFSQILNDPEHPPLSIIEKSIRFLRAIVMATSNAGYIYLLLTVLFLGCTLDRKRMHHRPVWFVLAALAVLVLMMDHYRHWKYINMTMWSINMLAVFALLLSKRPVTRRLFYCFWIPGMVYSFCLHIASNQEFYAISSASAVSALGSIVMIAVLADEMIHEVRSASIKTVLVFLVCLIFGFQIFSEAELRWCKVFWEDGIHSQTVPVSEGPQAGLLVSEEKAQQYADALHEMEVMEPYTGKKVLFLSKNTWYYLIHDCEMAAYSAWLSGVNEHTVARLETYYAINPDKLPDAVYADAEDAQIALLLGEKLGYRVIQTDRGIILEK